MKKRNIFSISLPNLNTAQGRLLLFLEGLQSSLLNLTSGQHLGEAARITVMVNGAVCSVVLLAPSTEQVSMFSLNGVGFPPAE